MKALHKEFWMEIYKSKARFLSIFFIVALGVAFFSGIQAASPDMRYSGDAYYNETNLMDLKVISTMGLTGEDVEALEALSGVEDAEGAYFTDVICGEEENQTVLHMESLTERFNQLTVSEGRLPQNSQEIFLDEEYAEKQEYKIGDTITLHEAEDSNLLKEEEYQIVGTGKSPLYISFNRGNTTLGSGEVDGFAYILPEDFEQEVYTEIYLHAHGSENVTSYTDAYDTLVERVKEAVEGIEDVRCQARLAQIKADAQEELDDGKKELDKGKAKAGKKLADAKKELDDGKEELEDGQKEYDDGAKALADAKKELEDGKTQLADGEQQLSDGWAQIDSAQEKVDTAKEQLAAAQQEITDGWAEVNENQKQLDESSEKLEESRKQYEEGAAQLEEAKKQLQTQQEQLDAQLAQVQSGQEQISSSRGELNTKRQECTAGLENVAAGEAELATGEAALAQAQQQLAELTAQRDAVQAGYDQAVAGGTATQEELDTLAAQLAELNQQVETATAQTSESAAALEANRAQLSATRSQLEGAIAEIDAGLAQLDTKETELAGAKTQLEAGQAQLDAGKTELDGQEKKLAEAKEQLESGQKQITEGQKKIDSAKAKLESGQKEVDSNTQQLISAQEEIESNKASLVSAQQTIAQSKQELADGEKEIAENEQKLEDAKKELEDGKQELEDGEKEYADGVRDARQEIAENEWKLLDAQKEVEDLEKPTWTVSDRNELPEYSDYGDNADRIRNIGKVFPVIFFLVAALISLTTMTRMVEEQRTQIGTMKALGYGKWAIASKYVNYALFATIGGSILGILVGEKVIPYVVITSYGIMYHNVSDTMLIRYEFKFALIAAAASVVCTVGATLFSCGRELRETPASLMRPPAPKEGKRVLVERIPILWKHLNFTWKSTLRNLFRYKKRLFMTIFGIAGSMGLMLVGFGIKDSIMDIALIQYQDLQHYEADLIEDEEATAAQQEKIRSFLEDNEKVDHCTAVQFTKVSVPKGSAGLSAYIMVPENLESFKKDVTLQNRVTKKPYELSDQGAAICEKTANLLGLEVGDEITIQKADKEYKVRVDIITENYMTHYIYMTSKVYKETFGEEPDYRCLLFTMKEEYKDDVERVGRQALNFDGALSISYTSSLVGQVERMLETLNVVILVLIVSAGMLAFVVLYNLNNINITERQRELATLKVLGFYDPEVSQYVFRENILLTVIGVLVGMVFGTLLHQYVITTVEVDAVMFGRTIKPASFLYSALFTVGFSLFVNATMHFKLKKIDMVESLKSVE